MGCKLNSLTLALAMSVSLSSMAATLEVWEGVGKSASIQNAVKAFETKYNCKVVLKEKDEPNQVAMVGDLASKNQKTPDVYILISDKFGEALSKDLIAPLNSMQQNKALYTPTSIAVFSKGTNVYAAPRSLETLVVYYNKDIIEYPYETLDAYKELGVKLQSQGKYPLLAKLDQLYFGYAFLGAHGGYIFGRDSNGNFSPEDLGVNSDGSVKGLKALASFSTFIPKEIFTDRGYSLVDEYFKQGKVAAVINGPWALEPYAKSGIDYGVAPLPKLNNGQFMHPFYGVKGYVVSSKSENKDLAEKFVNFINDPQYALARYQALAEVPPILAVLNNPLIQNDDFANAVSTQVRRADPMPYIPQMQLIWSPVSEAFLKAIEGADPKTVLDKAQEQIKAQY